MIFIGFLICFKLTQDSCKLQLQNLVLNESLTPMGSWGVPTADEHTPCSAWGQDRCSLDPPKAYSLAEETKRTRQIQGEAGGSTGSFLRQMLGRTTFRHPAPGPPKLPPSLASGGYNGGGPQHALASPSSTLAHAEHPLTSPLDTVLLGC